MTPEDLKNIAHEINTQDNRITADPLFCVFEKERLFSFDPDYSDKYDWCNSETRDVQQLEAGNLLSDEEAKHKGYEKIYYIERDRFINAHFTEKAAEEHIRINGHNLNEPFVFVTSLFRCEEMIKIREVLADNRLCLMPREGK